MKNSLSIFTQVFLAFLLFAIVPVTISSFLVVANYDQLVSVLAEELGRQNPQESYYLTRDALILVTMTIFITAMISFFASLLLSKSLTRPIQNLLAAINRVAKGDQGVRVRVQNTDELGRLSRGFNQMVKQLDAYQKEISQTKAGLEHRVAERTAELSLAYEQLKKTTEKINETNRLKSEFVANMSHELRTPLTAIIGFVDLLSDGIYEDLKPKQAEVLQKVNKNARQLLDLINHVLDLSKIEAGKMDVHIETFDLAELIKSTADGLRPLFDRKGLLLVVRTEGNLPKISQDAGMVRQILINLLSNALKFTEKGSVTVIAEEETGKNCIRIDVVDTGIGIPLDKQDLVFEQFLQLDGGTSRRYEGTGLGLALVRRLTDLLKGTVTMESRPGAGSRFTIYLPPGYYDFDPSDEPVADDSVKIMIVDDDIQTLAAISESLLHTDFRIIRCLGGAEACHKAREYNPAAILLDTLMPGKDGWMVCKELKSDPMTKQIPVIMMGLNDGMELDGVALETAGMLMKPVGPEKLQAAVHAALQRREQAV